MARIRLQTIPSDDTPPLNQVSIYSKVNKRLYLKNDTGAEYELLTNGSTFSGYNVEYITVSLAQELAKEIELPGTPTQPEKTLLDIYGGGGAQMYSVDYTLIDNKIVWSGLRLDGLLSEGDELRIIWS